MPWDELKPRKFAAFEKELDGISRQTMEDHYKLYEGYAKKANECRRILNEFDYSQIEGNQVYSPLRAVSVDYTFALLGYKNHDLYFGHLGGERRRAHGPLRRAGRRRVQAASTRGRRPSRRPPSPPAAG